MTDPLQRLVLVEAGFWDEVISGLHREAQRLRQHGAIVEQQAGSQASLDQIVVVLESVADKLRTQDGQMARALGRWDDQPVLGSQDSRYMPNRARRTASTAAAGPTTSTCAAPCRPKR